MQPQADKMNKKRKMNQISDPNNYMSENSQETVKNKRVNTI